MVKLLLKEFGDSMPVLRAWAEGSPPHSCYSWSLERRRSRLFWGEELTEGLKELEKFIKIAQAVPEQLSSSVFSVSTSCVRLILKKYLPDNGR